MPSGEVAGHLRGFIGHVGSLNEEVRRKEDATLLIKSAKAVLGLVTSCEFEENPLVWEALFKIAGKYDGFIFVCDSIVLGNGGVVIGPLKD
jgi:hypothetical protein